MSSVFAILSLIVVWAQQCKAHFLSLPFALVCEVYRFGVQVFKSECPHGLQILFNTGHCHITGLVKGGVNSGHLTPQTQSRLPGVLNLFGVVCLDDQSAAIQEHFVFGRFYLIYTLYALKPTD